MNSSNSLRASVGDIFKHPWFLPGVIIPIVLVLCLQLTGSIERIVGILFHRETTVEVKNIIIGSLQEMNVLNTANMSTKATAYVHDSRMLGRLRLGDTNLVYEAVGTVEAGIDMNQIDVKKIDSQHHKIHILLPPPRITEAFLDVGGSHVIVHYRRWWGPSIESELQDRAEKQALTLIQQEVCANNILEAANQQAKHLVEDILHSAGYQEVIVKTQHPQEGSCSV